MTERADIREIMGRGPVIPVVTISDAGRAVDLAHALLAGGISVIEVTLRTPDALAAASNIVEALPQMAVGIGTVLDGEQMSAAADCGAAFAVSPGLDPDLVTQAEQVGLAYLPGVQTTSEVMAAQRLGLNAMKFFPARPAGGPATLKQFAPVLPYVAFCPTGGVGEADVAEYLALPNVLCVGGSFVANEGCIDCGDWQTITETARRASAFA